MEQIRQFWNTYLYGALPKSVSWTDIAEIIVISFLVYYMLLWFKKTKAWSLLKGILVILIFIVFASIFNMSTILFIASRGFNVAAIALVVVFQPELRKALEQLGSKNLLVTLLPFDVSKGDDGLYNEKTVNEIVKASYEMGKVKTGALIVVEKDISLSEYVRTGIMLDSLLTSQLLVNIFEHNTPLHDGAVIVRGNRIVAATCYLPLSDNMELSKDLGTRHRAGVGISEATDSVTIIVSEETGRVSLAYEGHLFRNVDADFLKEKMKALLQSNTPEEKKFRFWKGRAKNEG